MRALSLRYRKTLPGANTRGLPPRSHQAASSPLYNISTRACISADTYSPYSWKNKHTRSFSPLVYGPFKIERLSLRAINFYYQSISISPSERRINTRRGGRSARLVSLSCLPRPRSIDHSLAIDGGTLPDMFVIYGGGCGLDVRASERKKSRGEKRETTRRVREIFPDSMLESAARSSNPIFV